MSIGVVGVSIPQDEIQKKLQEALVRKAEVYLRCLRRAAEDGIMETVEVIGPQLVALLQVKEFPSRRAQEILEASRAVQLPAYQRSVEVLLYQAEHRARDGDDKGRNEALGKAKQHFARAIRFGAEDDFRGSVERRVQAALMTSAKGVDEETKQAAARRLEAREHVTKAREGGDRRRAVRFTVPPLVVDIEGVTFGTVNWSQVGLLIEGYAGKPTLKAGDRVRLGLGCAGIEATEGQLARVIRVNSAKRQVALEFPEISTVILDLIRAMKRIGLTPRAR